MIGAQLRYFYGSGAEIGARKTARSRSHLLAFESGAYFAYGAGVMFLLLEPHLLAWFGADAPAASDGSKRSRRWRLRSRSRFHP